MKRCLHSTSLPNLECKEYNLDNLGTLLFKEVFRLTSEISNQNKSKSINMNNNKDEQDKMLFYFTGHGENETTYNSTISSLSLLSKNQEYFCLGETSRLYWKTWIKKLSSLSTNYCLWIDCCHSPFTFHEDWFHNLPNYIIIPNQSDSIAWMSDKGSKASMLLLKQLKTQDNERKVESNELKNQEPKIYTILKSPSFIFENIKNVDNIDCILQLKNWFS